MNYEFFFTQFFFLNKRQEIRLRCVRYFVLVHCCDHQNEPDKLVSVRFGLILTINGGTNCLTFNILFHIFFFRDVRVS